MRITKLGYYQSNLKKTVINARYLKKIITIKTSSTFQFLPSTFFILRDNKIASIKDHLKQSFSFSHCYKKSFLVFVDHQFPVYSILYLNVRVAH